MNITLTLASVMAAESPLDAVMFDMLADAAVRGAVLLALIAVLLWAMRRWLSASVRYGVWLCALVAVILVPVASRALPAWRVLPGHAASVRAEQDIVNAAIVQQTDVSPSKPKLSPYGTPSNEASQQTADTTAQGPWKGGTTASSSIAQTAVPTESSSLSAFLQRCHWRVWVLAVWMLGVIVALARLGIGMVGVSQLRKRGELTAGRPINIAFDDARRALNIRHPVDLLLGPRAAMPVAWGIMRPTILLPCDCGGWSVQRLHMVLLHELAHIRRRDCLTHLVARLVGALLWFHPLAWYAAAQLRAERERACDDMVLVATQHQLSPSEGQEDLATLAADYAEHLLYVTVRHTIARRNALAMSMARPSSLEGRMHAILDGSANRIALSLRTAAVIAVSVAIVSLPLALAAARDVPAPAAAEQAAFGADDAPAMADDAAVELDGAAGEEAAPAVDNEQSLPNAPAAAPITRDSVSGLWLMTEAVGRNADDVVDAQVRLDTDGYFRVVVDRAGSDNDFAIEGRAYTLAADRIVIKGNGLFSVPSLRVDGGAISLSYDGMVITLKREARVKLMRERARLEASRVEHMQQRLRTDEHPVVKRITARMNEIDAQLGELQSVKVESKPAANPLSWGKPVNGVRVRAVPRRAVWTLAETPVIDLEIENSGTATINYVAIAPEHCRIEVDGQWYSWGPGLTIRALEQQIKPDAPAPSRIKVVLVDDWLVDSTPTGTVAPGTDTGRAPLSLSPGEHTVRASFVFRDNTKKGTRVAAVSRPVTIKIVEHNPGEAVPTQQAMAPESRDAYGTSEARERQAPEEHDADSVP